MIFAGTFVVFIVWVCFLGVGICSLHSDWTGLQKYLWVNLFFSWISFLPSFPDFFLTSSPFLSCFQMQNYPTFNSFAFSYHFLRFSGIYVGSLFFSVIFFRGHTWKIISRRYLSFFYTCSHYFQLNHLRVREKVHLDDDPAAIEMWKLLCLRTHMHSLLISLLGRQKGVEVMLFKVSGTVGELSLIVLSITIRLCSVSVNKSIFSSPSQVVKT